MLRVEEHSLNSDHRFKRFELISWWDQELLRQSKVLVVGAGALGNEIIKNCALLGMGNLLVADMDQVENSNLSRSVLFREKNNGQYKAEVACEQAQDLYPEINVQPFVGNIVHDLGLGVYFWADLAIGGLDNREARVAINSAAAFARKSWIDGAIEVLNGVARVFSPNDGPCYECTMSEVDWKILESRRSCALLTRDEMMQGRVPTTPTIASIIAGMQAQEAVKLLHGMDSIAGKGFVFSGDAMDSYFVRYSRKPDCFGHETYESIERLGCGVGDITVGELLKKARNDLGADAVIGLSRDVIAALLCQKCDVRTPVYKSLGKVKESEAPCPLCGTPRAPETLLTLGLNDDLNDRTFEEIGTPYFDVVTARSDNASLSYLFDGDAERVLGGLSR